MKIQYDTGDIQSIRTLLVTHEPEVLDVDTSNPDNPEEIFRTFLIKHMEIIYKDNPKRLVIQVTPDLLFSAGNSVWTEQASLSVSQ